MFRFMKGAGITAALAAGTMAFAPVAEAHDGYYRHHDDTAAVAIGAGIIGLALGAAIASDDDGYYRDDYYYGRPYGYYYRSYPRYYYRTYPHGYYYDRYPRRYDYDRYPRHYYRYYRGYDRYGW